MAKNSKPKVSFGPGPGMPPEKPKDLRGTLFKLFAFMGAFKAALVVVFVFALGSTVFSIVGPKALSKATTELFTGVSAKIAGTGSIDFHAIGLILASALALYLLSAACSFVQSWTMSAVSQKTCYALRKRMSEKINRMPMGYFERSSVGDVLSRITNDVDTLGQSLNQGLTQLVTSIATIIGVFVMMLTISPLMTLITVVMVPVSIALVLAVVKRSQAYFVAQQRTLGAINGQIEETFSGQTVVRAFNKEADAIADFERTNAKLYDSAWRAQFMSGLMMPATTFVGNLGYVAVAVSGSYLAIQQVITVGDIQAFIQYVKNFTQPINQLSQVSNVLQQMAAAAERIFEFLEEDEEDKESHKESHEDNREGNHEENRVENREKSREGNREESHEGNHVQAAALAASKPTTSLCCADTRPCLAECACTVEFDHVRFGYDASTPVIKDFSAQVADGQTVALVGPTGAGKTTMVKLLMRFYDVDDGSIRIGGHDVREFNRADIRAQFGMVLQDAWLFKGSIRDNIRYGRLDATDEEVEEAARAAFAHHFISTLPEGYDTVITEDASNISQGQRQLLTIARAFLANRRMLILDEATSSVDTRTEERIQQAMDRLMTGRTSFVIAHRLSTIRNADLILVMREGDIVEQGTHDELLAAGGFYAQLYRSQFEGPGGEG